MSDHIQISQHGSVQLLRIARPGKKNALTQAMYAALTDGLDAGEASSAVAAQVITGSPGIFTAGNDIADFLAVSQSGGAVIEVLRFIQKLPRLQKPLIAAVDGAAVGIGTTLLFHCDLVYASPAALFSTPFLDLGLVPEAGSSLLMPRLMGHHRAFEMLALGQPLTAARAREAGFVNDIVDAAEVEATAMNAAQSLSAKPPEALAETRRLLRGDVATLIAQIDEEARIFERRLSSPEARRAFEAFLSKKARGVS